MIDKEIAHDLAVAAAAVSALKNFDIEVSGESPAEKRASFADYLQEEYESFLKHYLSESK